MSKVFISHSSKDREFVETELIPFLRLHGVEPWYSKRDIPSASDWERTIREALQSAEWFLVILSPDAIKSEWVQAEVHWAMDHRKERVAPIIIADCDPPDLHLQLIRYQYIDFRQNIDQARAQLLSVWGIDPRGKHALQVDVSIEQDGGCAEDALASQSMRLFISVFATIGRTPDAAICISSPTVSRLHATIKVRQHEGRRSLWLYDMGSGNATCVNEVELVAPVEIQTGDVIGVGDARITFDNIRPLG